MNPANPQLRFQLTFEGAWPTAVAFLGSSRRLAAANEAGQIYVWELPETPPELEDDARDARGKREAPDVPPLRRLDGHTNGVTRLVATSDGAELISASLDRTLRIWRPEDAAIGTAEVVLDADARKTEAKRTGKDNVLTAPGVKIETLTAAHVLEGHEDWIQSLGISRNALASGSANRGDQEPGSQEPGASAPRLISGDAASRVIVWDLPERREIARWSGLPWNWIAAASLSTGGETALVSEYRYKRDDFDIPAAAVRFYNASTGEEKLDLLKTLFPKYQPEETSYGAAQVWRKFVAQGLVAADFSPDGTLVALGQGGETDVGKVHLVEVATGKLVREVSGHQYGVTDVKFSADGQYVLSTGRDTMLRICQASDGKEVAALGKSRGGQFKDWLSALAISPDETMLAATDIAGVVHVWQLGS